MGRRWFPSREERENEIPLPRHTDQLNPSYQSAGLLFAAKSRRVDWLTQSFEMFACVELASFLSQLEEQGLAEATDSEVLVAWEQIYEIKDSAEYGGSYPLLMLPRMGGFRPCLGSQGSFSDADFSVFISGWTGADGVPLPDDPRIRGAVIQTSRGEALLEREAWETLRAVAAFHQRKPEERSAEAHRIWWSRIRQHAKAARAGLSHFLESTVVVTPEKLMIGLRKAEYGRGKVVEVFPNFHGQPPGWLATFDRFSQVQERYEVAHGEGLTHVVITPEVQTVLLEIKRMPARRVTGERAEAFLRNPFASLGPDAGKVIDAAQFEQARAGAGIAFARFNIQLRQDSPEAGLQVLLQIEEGDIAHTLPFADPDELEKFIAKLKERIDREAQCCPWHGYELEILGDTTDQLATLGIALQKWRAEKEYKPWEVFDLSFYSDRIAGFGVEKPYYQPFLRRRTDGWFPDSVAFGVHYLPEGSKTAVALALSDETIEQFERALRDAKQENRTEFAPAGFPKPIRVAEAEALVAAFKKSRQDLAARALDPEQTTGRPAVSRLIIKRNDETVNYAEPGGDLTPPAESKPLLPRSLKRNVTLLQHQLSGIAWLQHLWRRSPGACRGALLADDMGLGKTLQLLTLMAWCLEQDATIDPFLIVAPVALLENWKQEIDKFFVSGTFSVLTLYGPALREKRLARSAIQQELLHAGVTRLLIRGWLGNAKVVLTTYETLRDLEFSLARQKWSVMVCDEAQKIKTPGAMVSRAARKQNARFKIACTGTPVENTLTDLWCLFDFIQPGMLGSLKDFGERYRRPIEVVTEEEKAQLEELRRRIAPQTLRRTKAEVARDLPRKVIDRGCRSLAISERQRAYYGSALEQRRIGEGAGSSAGLNNHLGLLLYLRTVCSDPRPPGPCSLTPQPLNELEQYSPKMRWMLAELVRIRSREEKVIVFCEVKELQRTIQRAIAERLGIVADIINGDTSAAGAKGDIRQKRIGLFQQKPGFGVILLSPLAVGFGLNIQAANHVIHFTRPWNPAREDQATDRSYRIGQTRDVFVYYPVVVAEDFVTFDEKLDQLLENKRKLSQDMLNGCGDIGLGEFADIEGDAGSEALNSQRKPDALWERAGRHDPGNHSAL
jgi:SNF2-related domain/Helicase conserved C-terminal domain